MSSTIQNRLAKKLKAAFHPTYLEIINESQLHHGHQHGAFIVDGTGESHLRVKIHAPAFASLSRLERHRAILNLAQEEFGKGLHALAIEAQA
ncbi:BolA family protein [Bartonella sp. DGB2]|uniref:BolA family protein n=1 Tax=Bartonella sp. DGB2 TaxID=3388426 RepID=UPI00398FDAC1